MQNRVFLFGILLAKLYLICRKVNNKPLGRARPRGFVAFSNII